MCIDYRVREINGISNEMVNETQEVAIKPTTSVLQVYYFGWE